jgi:hypothetical protein
VSVVKDAKLNTEDLQETIDNIHNVKTSLLGDITASSGFAHEISWLNPDLMYDFNVIEVCRTCPAGTFFDNFRRDLTEYVINSKSRDALFKKINSKESVEKLRVVHLTNGRCHNSNVTHAKMVCTGWQINLYLNAKFVHQKHSLY